MTLKRRIKATKDFEIEKIALLLIVASAGMFTVKYQMQFSVAGVGERLLLCWGAYVRP